MWGVIATEVWLWLRKKGVFIQTRERERERCGRHWRKASGPTLPVPGYQEHSIEFQPNHCKPNIFPSLRQCNKLPPWNDWLINIFPSKVNFSACNTMSHKSSYEFHIWKFFKPQNHCHWLIALFAIRHSRRFHHPYRSAIFNLRSAALDGQGASYRHKRIQSRRANANVKYRVVS